MIIRGVFLAAFAPRAEIPITLTPLIRRNSRREKEGFTLIKFRTFSRTLWFPS
jgi:hypothetical protein